MPINQPTQIIQRPWNNVNVSGAILTPFAQGLGTGLGEVASSGLKDLLGIRNPQEAYYQAEADAKRQSTDDKIRENLTNLRGNPNYNPADDKKYVLAYTDGDEERAQRILDSTLDTPEAHGKREIGWTYNQQLSNEQRPTPFGSSGAVPPGPSAGPISSALSGSTGAALTASEAPEQSAYLPEVTKDNISAQAPLPAPGPPEDPAKQATSAAINQAQETSSEALNSYAQMPAPLTPAPEVLTPAASPTGLLESKPQGLMDPQPMSPEQRQAFAKDLQSYQTRLQGASALYQQSLQALTKGDVDPKATANALNLANMHTAELTKLMQTAAPSFGLPTVDIDGKPLMGDFTQDGIGAAQLAKLEAMRVSDPAKFNALISSPEGKKVYQGYKEASERWQMRLGRVPAEVALAYQDKVVKTAGEMVPFSVLANYNVAVAQNEENKRSNLVGEAQKNRQLSAYEQQVASEVGLRHVQTEEARLNLGILQKYAPAEAALKIQQAQQAIEMNEANLAIKSTDVQKERLALDMAALTSLTDMMDKGEDRYFRGQQREVANYEMLIGKTMKDQVELANKFQLQMYGWKNQMQTAQKTMTPDKVQAYIRATGGKDEHGNLVGAAAEVLKRPADEQFEYWYAHTNSDYASYYNAKQSLNEYQDRLQANLNVALQRQYKPAVGEATMSAANQQATQAISNQVQDRMRLFAKDLLKQAPSWDEAIADHPTVINELVSGWIQTKGGFRPQDVWTTAESKSLAALTQWSLRTGRKLGVEDFSKVPVGSKTLQQTLEPDKLRKFYNAYDKLYTEMK